MRELTSVGRDDEHTAIPYLPIHDHGSTGRTRRALTIGIVLVSVSALTLGSTMVLRNTAKSPATLTVLRPPHKTPPVAETISDRPARPLAFYQKGVTESLFRPQPVAQQPAPATLKPVAKPPVIVKAPPVPPPNPFAGWVYTGTVHMGEETIALLEKPGASEGEYVEVDDPFQGAQVAEVTDDAVTLVADGKRVQLPKSDAVSVTPLDHNAAFLPSGGGAGPAGGPNRQQR